MRRWLPYIIVVVVGMVTFAAGAMLYRSYRQKVIIMTQAQQEASRREALHVRGFPKAPVTIEEFGDFQCPPCGRLSGPLNGLERSFPRNVRLVFREYPLDSHNHAKAAAYAAEAAGLQGKFWDMHDLLYQKQETWAQAAEVDSIFDTYARLLGLDLGQFRRDLKGETVKARIAVDLKRANELGVNITPSIFINGKLVTGRALSPAGLRSAVEAALASSPSQ